MSRQTILADEKYKVILAYEEEVARNVPAKVLDKPELSFWMFFFPIVFVPYMYRHKAYKESLKVFSQGYLFTKKVALEAACLIYKNEQTWEEALEKARLQVYKKPDAVGHILEIYQKQMLEISLLVDHYLKLLNAAGESYRDLIVDAYQTRSRYLEYLQQLAQAEREVNAVAVFAVKSEETTLSGITGKMEQALAALRHKEAEQFFV
ncbi:MAG: NF038143 family protein [Bacillota bacterium]